MATYTYGAPFSSYNNGIGGLGPWISSPPNSTDDSDTVFCYHASGPKDPDPNDVESAGSVNIADNGAIPSNIIAVGNTTIILRVKTDSLAELGTATALIHNAALSSAFNLGDETSYNNYSVSMAGPTTRAQMFSYDYGCGSATSNHVGASQRWSRIRVTFSFTLAPPTAVTGSASNITPSSATLTGTINPVGGTTAFPASYKFEYGFTDSYGSSSSTQTGFTGSSDVAASADIAGLAGGTTYHFRVVAINDDSVVNGSDQTFVTTAGDASVLHY